jgi:hypothetical protein
MEHKGTGCNNVGWISLIHGMAQLQARTNNTATYSRLAWLIIMGSGLDDWIYWYFTIVKSHNQWLSTTCSIPCWTTSVFSSTDWLDSDLRIGHFFSFRCPLVNTPQLNTQLLNSLTIESLEFNEWTLFYNFGRIKYRPRHRTVRVLVCRPL